jgi:hypothetical protein
LSLNKGFLLIEFLCATLIFVLFVKAIFIMHAILENKKEEIFVVLDGLRFATNIIERREIFTEEKKLKKISFQLQKFGIYTSIKNMSDNFLFKENKLFFSILNLSIPQNPNKKEINFLLFGLKENSC